MTPYACRCHVLSLIEKRGHTPAIMCGLACVSYGVLAPAVYWHKLWLSCTYDNGTTWHGTSFLLRSAFHAVPTDKLEQTKVTYIYTCLSTHCANLPYKSCKRNFLSWLFLEGALWISLQSWIRLYRKLLFSLWHYPSFLFFFSFLNNFKALWAQFTTFGKGVGLHCQAIETIVGVMHTFLSMWIPAKWHNLFRDMPKHGVLHK